MIRIRKSKTTRKKLTGPSAGKSVAEKASQVAPESRDQFKGQSRDQFKSQPREQPREQSRDQFKGQPRSQPREQSKDHFRGDQSKKRRFPYPKKAPRGRTEAPESRTPCEPATPEEELEKGGFVLPGELIGTIEEFKPGEGTTVSVGDIYSSATGNVVIDRKARIVSVRPSTLTPNILKVGDVIYGKIIDVRESGAMVEIAANTEILIADTVCFCRRREWLLRMFQNP